MVFEMSIDAEEFERHKNPLKHIISFLKKNSERAFTAKSIGDAIGIDQYEVATAIRWEAIAGIFNQTYRIQVEMVTIKGITYYKYKS